MTKHDKNLAKSYNKRSAKDLMFAIFKSYIAHWNWMKARAMMADLSPDIALITIRKAIDIVPEEEKKAVYLELQGHIEISLNKRDSALKSFKSAKAITESVTYEKDKEIEKLKERLIAQINEMEEESSS